MAEFTERHEKMLQETHDATIRIEAKMSNGWGKKLDDVCNSHSKLKRNFYLLVGILVGSGVLTGTIIGVLNNV